MKNATKYDTLQKNLHILPHNGEDRDSIFNHGKNSFVKSHQIMLSNGFSEGISKVVFASDISEIKNTFIN